MSECPTCHGSREVRYPKRLELTAVMEPDCATIDPVVAEYRAPCPDCAGGPVPQSRISIEQRIYSMPEVKERAADLLDHVSRSCASAIGVRMLTMGLAKVEVGDPDARCARPVRVTIGIVSPQHVASIEERARDRQFEVAEQLVAATREEIANWASFYHGRAGGSVRKDQAIEWMVEALKKIKARVGRA